MTTLTLAVVLDRSGSMDEIWKEVIGSLDTMLDEQSAEGMTTVVPVVFDDRIDVLEKVVAGDGQPIPDSVKPRGMTALYDGIAAGIHAAEQYAGTTDKTAVVIVTDGYENHSKEYDAVKIAGMIDEKRAAGWEFIFIGANQDAWATGGGMGIASNHNWEQTAVGTRAAYNDTSRKLSSYRNT